MRKTLLIISVLSGCVGGLPTALKAAIVLESSGGDEGTVLSAAVNGVQSGSGSRSLIGDALELDVAIQSPDEISSLIGTFDEPAWLTSTDAEAARANVLLVAMNVGQSAPEADFNRDGTVGVADLAHFPASVLFAAGPMDATVNPEPAAWVTWFGLLVLSAGAAIWRRATCRRRAVI
jgi:hypothetical protein